MNSAGFSVASTSNPRCSAICAIATVACGMHSVCLNAAVLEKMSALNRLCVGRGSVALAVRAVGDRRGEWDEQHGDERCRQEPDDPAPV